MTRRELSFNGHIDIGFRANPECCANVDEVLKARLSSRQRGQENSWSSGAEVQEEQTDNPCA